MGFANIYITLRHLSPLTIFKEALCRILSIRHYYLIKINLSKLPAPLKTRPSITVNKINHSDIEELMSSLSIFSEKDRKDLLTRMFFSGDGFKNGYMGRTMENEMAVMQWLIYPKENQRIKRYHLNRFDTLKPGQVMIENAFTFPRFRGFGLLRAVSLQLMYIAKSKGYKSCIGYVLTDNIESLNEMVKLGFKITKKIPEYRILGISWRRF